MGTLGVLMGPTPESWQRLAGSAAAVSLALGWVGSLTMNLPPFPIQRLLRTSVAAAAVVVALAVLGMACLALWARAPGHPDRSRFVAALMSLGAMVAAVNVAGPAGGFWVGPIFDGPLLSLALITAVGTMVNVGLLLFLYRWVSARRRWLAKVLYAAILIALIPARVVYGDQMALDAEIFAFANGYTIWHDLLMAEVFLLVPLVVYEVPGGRRGAPGTQA